MENTANHGVLPQSAVTNSLDPLVAELLESAACETAFYAGVLPETAYWYYRGELFGLMRAEKIGLRQADIGRRELDRLPRAAA